MEEREQEPGSTEQPKKSSVNWYGVILIVILVVVVGCPFWLALTPVGPGTGSGAYFKNVAAFQQKFAPVMAFPTYYPEGFDWRGHENEWFEYENEHGRVYFNWNTYDLKSERTRMYANATCNGYGVWYQRREDLDIYTSAETGVSLEYPKGGVPDGWLFYVGMQTLINPRPRNPNAPKPEKRDEILRYNGVSARFQSWKWNENRIGKSFTSFCYILPYEGRDYCFIFGIRFNPALSGEKQDELFAEMKQHCLEEAVKMYDSLEYLEKVGD